MALLYNLVAIAPVLGLSKLRTAWEHSGPKAKAGGAVPAVAVEAWAEWEELLRQQVGPEEPVVLGPCSLAVVVLVVHDEHVELMLRQWLIVICLLRGSVLLFYDHPIWKQVVGARIVMCFKINYDFR